MYILRVEVCFSAAHRVKELKKCEKLHGHNFKVEVFLEGETLGREGWLMDFREIKKILSQEVKRFDHQYLNRLKEFRTQNPTSENIARVIFERLKSYFPPQKVRVSEVRVWESEDKWASYREK